MTMFDHTLTSCSSVIAYECLYDKCLSLLNFTHMFFTLFKVNSHDLMTSCSHWQGCRPGSGWVDRRPGSALRLLGARAALVRHALGRWAMGTGTLDMMHSVPGPTDSSSEHRRESRSASQRVQVTAVTVRFQNHPGHGDRRGWIRCTQCQTDSTWQVHKMALSALLAGLPEHFYFRDLCRRIFFVEVRHDAPFLECKTLMLHASACIFVVGIVGWSPID